ncbi:MAG: ABC transporter permease [Nitrososphaerota archaeon]|nr:ABC transporter permease [Nitrososphaerota archaeon]
MNPLKALVVKEFKDLLREPQILIGIVLAPILMLGLMGGILSTTFSSVREATAGRLSIAVLDLDRGVYSSNLIDTLKRMNVSIYEVESKSIDEAILEASSRNLKLLLIVPEGFSGNVTLGVKAKLQVYSNIESFSLLSTIPSSAIQAYIATYEHILAYSLLRRVAPSIDPSFVLDPVSLDEYTVIQGSVVKAPPSIIFQRFFGQSLMLPFSMFIVVIVAMQIAATSMAKEKEERTLEVLLTLPVKRIYILMGKLAGSILIAIIGSISYLSGFAFYLSSFSAIPQEELAGLDVRAEYVKVMEIPLQGYIVIGALLTLSLIAFLSIAVGLSALADDVRSAQSLLGIVFIPLIIPFIFTLFVDVNTLPVALKILVYAIPLSYPMLSINSILSGDYFTPIVGILYLTIFTLAVLYVSAWFFESEKILTAKIKVRFMKKPEASDMYGEG